MLLTRLEIQGLKSFADKTVLDLRNNITAIVGPNGAGKSNITDAIRWLLGERDARNLRGAKSEDLIFAGTEKRARMGLAQATLYFDNSSGVFPIDFKEVSITRRISRDGVSQFFINKSEVRLKDLIDFLARVKLGARGLTVISQGQSDAFIVASPTERREMIEEILGLKEYQLKKANAERKLKNTEFNLEKVRALIDEIKPHLRLLKRQSSRYENRERITTELFELENTFYGSRLARFQEKSKELEKEAKVIEEKINKEEPEFQKIEKEFNLISEGEPETARALKRIQKQKQEVLTKRNELSRELGRLEIKIEFQSQELLDENADVKSALKEIKSIAEDLVKGEDIEHLRSMAGRVIKIIEDLFVGVKGGVANNSDIKGDYDKLIVQIKTFDAEVEKLNKEEEANQASLEGFNKKFKDAYRLVESRRDKREEFIREKNRISLDRERVTLKLENLKEELTQIGRSFVSLKEEVEKKSGISGVLVDEDVAMSKMFKLRQELASIGDIDESIIKEAKETEERNEFLTKQVDDLGKATADLMQLIKELEDKIQTEFDGAIKAINAEFSKLINTMFDGGKARLVVNNIRKNDKKEMDEVPISTQDFPEERNRGSSTSLSEQSPEEVGKDETRNTVGVDIDISLPKKRVKGLDILSGGERSLVSIAALFALISVSPPPFLVLDEIDAALDERNAKRFGQTLREFSKKTQFIVITHNRATMEVADALYGVTMSADGTSKLVSLKLE